MKRNILKQFIIAAIMITAIAGISYGQTARTPRNTYQVRCLDRNKSLFLLIYEKEGKLDGGYMFIENIKVGTLIATNAGTDVIRAKVYGNTSNTGFEIHKSGAIFTADYTPNNPSRVEVCKASYKYYQ